MATDPRIPVRGDEPAPTRPLLYAALVSAVVTVVSYALPDAHAATGVGLAFLAAVGWLVLRHDGETIRHYGLALGGLLEPAPIEWRTLLGAAISASLLSLAVVAVVFPPFVIGFRIYWHVAMPFHWRLPLSLRDEMLGQLLVVAIPEEAFYRGYLQTALDDRWGTPFTLFGAKLGWGVVASSAIFAAGHFLTEPYPARLAVFFPSLLFGWMRARSGGIGAGALFHAVCNLFAATLTRGYGLAA